jgi:hydrogenase maturation protease
VGEPLLIVALGNPLMGDDGVAVEAAESLAGYVDTDVLLGGTDLLRHSGDMEGRERVILVDAVESDTPGTIIVTDDDPPEGPAEGAHTLSGPTAVRLLRRLMPDLRFTWVLTGVRSARIGEGLSPEVAAALPRLQWCLMALTSGRDPVYQISTRSVELYCKRWVYLIANRVPGFPRQGLSSSARPRARWPTSPHYWNV